MGSKRGRRFAVYYIGPNRTSKVGEGSTHCRTIYKGDTIPQRHNFYEYERIGIGKGGHIHVKNPNFKSQLKFVMERPERFKVDLTDMGSRWNRGKEAKELRAARKKYREEQEKAHMIAEKKDKAIEALAAKAE